MIKKNNKWEDINEKERTKNKNDISKGKSGKQRETKSGRR